MSYVRCNRITAYTNYKLLRKACINIEAKSVLVSFLINLACSHWVSRLRHLYLAPPLWPTEVKYLATSEITIREEFVMTM